MAENASDDFNELVKNFLNPQSKFNVRGLVAILARVYEQKNSETPKTTIRKELGYIYFVDEGEGSTAVNYLDQYGIRRTIFYNPSNPQYGVNGELKIGEIIEVEVDNIEIKSVRTLKLNAYEKKEVVARFNTLE